MRVLAVRLASTFAALNVTLALSAFSQGDKPAFSVFASAPATNVADARQLKLSITLTNTSDHAIEFDEDGSIGETNFLVEVFDATGKSAPETSWTRAFKGEPTEPGPYHLVFGVGSSYQRPLKPGESQVYPVYNLCTLYHLIPGVYTLVATGYDFQLRPDQPPHGDMTLRYEMMNRRDRKAGAKVPIAVRSNTLHFSITTESCPAYKVPSRAAK